jgi:hypothetical protein
MHQPAPTFGALILIGQTFQFFSIEINLKENSNIKIVCYKKWSFHVYSDGWRHFLVFISSASERKETWINVHPLLGPERSRVTYCYSTFLFHYYYYYITTTVVGWCIVILRFFFTKKILSVWLFFGVVADHMCDIHEH